MGRKSFVKDYMTKSVISVSPNTKTDDVIELMRNSHHNSYPVVKDDKLVGMVTAFDLVAKKHCDLVEGIMTKNLVVANQDLSINDASRVMFRHGVSRLPVVDNDRHVKGIITNTDMVRSHIERSTPTKVNAFKTSMEQLYDIKTLLTREQVPVELLTPTQDRVYADELQGRVYELKRGLAEPAIVVKTGDRYILVDGHHRAVASTQLGLDRIDSYVIDLQRDIKLGLERTAERQGLEKFSDINIIEEDQHPLIALTETIKSSKN